MAEAEGEPITLEGLIERSIRNAGRLKSSLDPCGEASSTTEWEAIVGLHSDLVEIADMVRGVDVVLSRMGEGLIGSLSVADARLKLASTIQAVDLADARTLEKLNRAMRALKEAEDGLLAIAGEAIDRPWKAEKAQAEGRAVRP